MASPENLPTSPRRTWVDRAVVFLLLALATITFPRPPTADLDASWRMAMGKYLLDGLQFGHDVVFTYGPLGFLMGKTYYGSGILLKLIIGWQFLSGIVTSLLIMMWGERLQGWPRILYYGFFILFGVTYEDALYMLALALGGAELIRRNGSPWHWRTTGILLYAAVLGVIKFTNLMLAIVVVVLAIAHALWIRERGTALRLAGWFFGGWLAFWMACAQNPVHLPEYFRHSWEISQGYQLVMGISTPFEPFWKALVVCGLLAAYFVLTLATHRDRPRAVAYLGVMGALVYLNWKHGFVRSDGHMIGFFYCALLPAVAFPVLLDDGDRWRRTKRALLVPATLLAVIGVRDTLPGVVDSALGIFQARAWENIRYTASLPSLREEFYNIKLHEQRRLLEMPRVQSLVNGRSIDVIGFEQSVALFNRYNYTPRPVIQSYSAYTPALAKLNADFYASDRAPDFVLIRIQSIDERLGAMDDSAALNVISHRYTYRLSEKGYSLWERNPGPFDPAKTAPQPLVAKTFHQGEQWNVEAYAKDPLWLEADIRPSLLGRLRNFLYKPPLVYLIVTDQFNRESVYRLPAPLGQAGFIINPLVEDMMGYVNFTGGKPERYIRQLRIHIDPRDHRYFEPDITLKLSKLVVATGGHSFFELVNTERFHMFRATPVSFDAQARPTEEKIDNEPVMIMHAPSEMVFNLPPAPTVAEGRFGFLSGAYTGGNHTNGADFTITWSDGKSDVVLYHRFLDPLNREGDRGLQPFRLDLKGLKGGRLYFRVGPGPFSDHGWDWTGWTGIDIH